VRAAGLYVDFEVRDVETSRGAVHAVVGGHGPPVLLLHGYPQSLVMWRGVAPLLAERHTVVATDLAGYGASFRPVPATDHAPHGKRAMALDQIEAMAALGFDRFTVAGHDRGGRVAYRMALDHPDAVERLAVLDIVPTGEVWGRADAKVAAGRYPPEVLDAYRRTLDDPATVEAMREDCRAGATIDVEHDDADREAGRRIASPTLVLWSARGGLPRFYPDVLDVWRPWAPAVHGRGLDGSHFLPEDCPEIVASELLAFTNQED
jgi:haloacetate dehalogenase